MNSTLVLLTLVAASGATSILDSIKDDWNSFKTRNNKSYLSAGEERLRLMIFNENKLKIALHNKLYDAKKVSYKMAVNEFTDMLEHEFLQAMTGYSSNELQIQKDPNDTFVTATYVPSDSLQLAAKMDWRQQGAVTPVKNQGRCGSCWAFSATGSLEGQHFRKTGQLISLSEQNLIDCSGKFGNNGCQGGWMNNAFNYIIANRGINTEKTYPYKGVNDLCRFDKSKIGATVQGIYNVPKNNEDALLKAVSEVGPISVAVDATYFQFYAGGIFDEPKCRPNYVNHGVLVVGYGTESKGQEYWLVKNSWGSNWGEQGYIKMSRNKKNQCSIAYAGSFPIV